MLQALEAILRYRYLTVSQVATQCGANHKSTSAMLLRLERQKYLGSFGNIGIRGYGKTPKVYFLTKRGYSVVAEELDAQGRSPSPYRQVNLNSRWSPLMYHRLATLDVLSYIERDCRALQGYELLGTLVEYRREKVGKQWRKETTDVVSNDAGAPKIVPDAGFALQNTATGQRALFLIEVDQGTTRIETNQTGNVASFTCKLEHYDRYLASGRVRKRYPNLGDFTGFRLLTVTTSNTRIANMRQAAARLALNFHQYYRFSTFDAVREHMFHSDWLNRDYQDQTTYSLIKGS